MTRSVYYGMHASKTFIKGPFSQSLYNLELTAIVVNLYAWGPISGKKFSFSLRVFAYCAFNPLYIRALEVTNFLLSEREPCF